MSFVKRAPAAPRPLARPNAGPPRLGILAAPAALAACLMAAAPAHAQSADIRIINGSTSTAGAWPWAVTINEPRGGVKGFCTGTLVAPRWALTAAHCFEADVPAGYVRVGNIGREVGTRIDWDSAHLHPGFNRNPPDGHFRPADDIALVYLGSEAPPHLGAVALADADIQTRLVTPGASSTGIGWGTATTSNTLPHDTLQEAEFEIRDGAACGNYGIPGTPPELFWDPATQVCSGSGAPGPNTCKGDSGGPLLVREGATWHQVGVSSLTATGCNGPSIHMQVAAYRDWIDATMAAELDIDSPSVAEGAMGSTAALTFTVTTTRTSPAAVRVGYRVSGGSARAGDDYRGATTGTVTIATSTNSATFTIDVIGDGTVENHETVEVTLENPNGARIRTAMGTGTITNDDTNTVPTLSIDSPRGNEGAPELLFTVRLSPTSSNDVEFRYAVSGGTATSTGPNADYQPLVAAMGTIPANQPTTTIPVALIDNNAVGASRTVEIEISNPTVGTAIRTAVGTGTILDDDRVVSITSPGVTEGGLGNSRTLPFTVELSETSPDEVTVDWSTTGGTATAGEDYMAANGTLTIPANTMSAPINVTVTGDDRFEPDETVVVTLSNALGAMAATSTEGVISNDDLPTVSISAADVPEGAAGPMTMLVFTVTLSATSSEAVTFDYAVRGTATAVDDFTVPSGTVTVPANATSAAINVAVVADNVFEPDETVVIELTRANGLAIPAGTAVATGTIQRDEPGISIDSPGVAEGASGTTAALEFTVMLDRAAAGPVTVQYAVTGGTATSTGADADYRALPAGSLTFTAGDTEETIPPIMVIGDNVSEPDETVVITLSAPTGGAEILQGRGTGTGTIRNDDLPRLTIGSPSVAEGDRSESPTLGFEVALDRAATGTVTVDWSTTGGTATAGEDYAAANGTLMFAPGDTMRTARVTVRGDDELEPDETVVVTLSGASGAMIATSTGTGTIRNDDVPEVSISAADVQEGAQGETTRLVFTVTLSATSSEAVTFQYVVKGTATAGTDYTAPSGTVTIPAGMTSAEIVIVVTADDVFEPDETVVIELTSANGVSIPAGRETGTGTIQRDEPGFSIDSPSVAEGASGTRAALTFTVTLDPAAAGTVTVRYAVAASSTATAGEDYVALPADTLTFTAGETEMTIPVMVIGDDEGEPNETVVVTLSMPTGGAGVLPDMGTGTGTIRNDDTDSRARALKSILAGVGRTIASSFVDLVWDRVDAHRSGNGESYATVGGLSLDSGAFAGGGPDDGAALRAAGGIARLLGIGEGSPGALLRDAGRRYAAGGGLGAFRDWVDLPDDRDLVGRTRFSLPFAGHDGGHGGSMAVWGRGSLASFESGLKHDGFSPFSAEGEVASGHLGIEYRSGGFLAGIALGHALGDVDYWFEDENESRGSVKTELTSAHPYLHWMSPAGLGVWGAVGYGAGEAELEDGDGRIETDIAMEMAAIGVRGTFAHSGNRDLAVKADVLMAKTTADEVEGGDLLAEVTADSSRARLALESSSERILDGGAVVAGSFELGARLDGGDAEQGAGADIAAAFGYMDPHSGFDLRGRGSLLLAHEENDFGEWSLGLGLAWDPGVRGRGLRLSLEPGWGVPAAGSSMWGADPGRHGAARSRAGGAVLNARLGYGMGVWEDRALVTVFGELGRTDGAGRLRLGAGLRQAGAGGAGLELYGESLDRPAGTERQVILKGRLGF